MRGVLAGVGPGLMVHGFPFAEWRHGPVRSVAQGGEGSELEKSALAGAAQTVRGPHQQAL
ncbi:hypothetical protein Lesp01_31630 [Lentzea sp. NBRC 102530]|nr:hypothetical protein Lesp01_31630 [Lentzea sp. NBRC 102530]